MLSHFSYVNNAIITINQPLAFNGFMKNSKQKNKKKKLNEPQRQKEIKIIVDEKKRKTTFQWF